MATLIKTDGTHTSVEPKNGKDFQIEELWDLIGGYVQIVYINPREILIVDEDGLNKHLPINKEASYLYGDLIVGPALRCLNTQVK